MVVAACSGERGVARFHATDSVKMQVVEVEMVDFPPCAFFKIAVERTGCENRRHHVTKCFADLQLLHELLKQELEMSFLPAPPHSRSVAESDSLQYRMLLNVHLSTLARDASVRASQIFRDFFQLSDEYQQTSREPTLGPASRRELAPRSMVNERSGPLAQTGPKPLTPLRGVFDGSLDMHSRKSADVRCAQSISSGSSTRCSTPRQVTHETSARASTPSEEARSPSPGNCESDAQALVFSEHLGCRRLLEAVETAQPQEPTEAGPRDGCECVVCMERPQEVAIIPCGHLSMCHICAPAMSACPVCRGSIDRILRIYTA